MAEFMMYPTATGKQETNAAPLSLRKLTFGVSPPPARVGSKRAARDEEDGPEEEDDALANEALLEKIAQQKRKHDSEYTQALLAAIRDFYVTEPTSWLKKYFHSAIAHLKEMNKSGLALICTEIESSLDYWAQWHADQFVQKLRLDSEADCMAFLDSFTLALVNWAARAKELKRQFAWVEVEYKQRERRSKRGIVDLALKAIDSKFVRNATLWNAVNTAVDRLTSWSRPLRADMLDRVVVLERVYASHIRGSPLTPAMTGPILQDPEQFLLETPDVTTAVFSPVLRVLVAGTQYAAQQVALRRAPNVLEDWAARACFWTSNVTAVFNYLLEGAELTHLLVDAEHMSMRPEWQTSHRFIKESLSLLSPQVAAYALGLLPEVPHFERFIQSAYTLDATQELVFDAFARVMYNLAEQLISFRSSASILERIRLLGLSRVNLARLCNPQKRQEAETRFTKAMQEAVKAIAGPLLLQLRHAVQHGSHLSTHQAVFAELRSLDLNLTPEDTEDDEAHSRMLAEDVAVDLLPENLGGAALDPHSERQVLTSVAGDFRDHGIAFTWMPMVMACEAVRQRASSPLLLHYVAWLAARDPLVTHRVPAAIAPYVGSQAQMPDVEVKWHPSWSVVTVRVAGSTFDCSVVQFEIITKLLQSSVPVQERDLAVRENDEPEDAILARRAALLDLVKNSDGFVRFSPTDAGVVYAVDASKLPMMGRSFAMARFAYRDDT